MLTLPGADASALVAAPDQLDVLAAHTTEIGRRILELAAATDHALRDLAVALPRSRSAAAVPDTKHGCVELLRAEGSALRSLGTAFAAAAASYRSTEAAVAGRAQAGLK